MKKRIGLDKMVWLLKTIAEANHLRILTLLYYEDFTIADFIFVLGQSQSSVSRHLCLLCEARLIERYKKGRWIYFKLCHGCVEKDIMMVVLSALPESDLILAHDLARLGEVKKERQKREKKVFSQKVRHWERARLAYIADHALENTLHEIVGDKPFETMLGIGIGTGAVLKLFSRFYTRAMEIVLDSNILHLPVGDETFDLILLHWALHFLENPEMALYKVAGVLRPHGRLLVVDSVHYEDESTHFYDVDMYPKLSGLQIEHWLKNAGLILEKTTRLASLKNERNERFTITFWLARDKRLLIDDIKDKKIEFA
ncbi:ArsR/SmtB family transcription factor [Bartonella rattaustraliani]|uniref:ArsR/SmtB family transcription factor n=1 Tax=Bartonella rattaustraliani TaxID=481139 RepID=UPI0002FDD1DD|nr:methyltransferase domain-containing protein [Bartonella rattaustraliani]